MAPVVLALLTSTSTFAAAKIVVVPVEPASEADAAVASALQGPLEAALDSVPEFAITTSREIKTVLELHKQSLVFHSGEPDVDQERQVIEAVRRTFTGDLVAIARLGRSGERFLFSVALLRLADASSVGRYAVAPTDEAALAAAVQASARALRERYVATTRLAPELGLAAKTDPESSSSIPWQPAALAGAGGLVGGVAVGLGVSAVNDLDVGRARAADVLLGASVAAVAAGLVWLAIDLFTDD
ncbi:MAG: hypothetical protein RIT81_22970 [Deltaproteobacteria bacterium]